MKISLAIAWSAVGTLLSAAAAPLPVNQDLKRIAEWVNAAPSKDRLGVTWQRMLREMHCRPTSEPAKVLETQVLRCTVDAQRAAALGSVIAAMELRTFVKPQSFDVKEEVWTRSLSVEFQSGNGPTAGSLLDMKFKEMRLLAASAPVPSPHGPSSWDACPIEFEVVAARSIKTLLISPRQKDGGCTGKADELVIVDSTEAPPH